MNTDEYSPLQSAHSIVYIDPPMARRLLEKNTRNRNIVERHILGLMNEMTSGRWQFNGEAIKWSVDNVLLDGQCRLTALSRLDDSYRFPFLVVRHLPTSSQDTMDQGRTRSAADQLTIDGVVETSNTRLIAGATRVYLQWTRGLLFKDFTKLAITNSEVLQWAKSHPLETALLATDIGQHSLRQVPSRPSLTAAILLRLYLIDDEWAREFQGLVLSGAGLNEGDPILTLRRRLQRIRDTKVKTPDRDIIAFYVLAWNAWREGRTLSKFQRPDGGSYNEGNFPVPR